MRSSQPPEDPEARDRGEATPSWARQLLALWSRFAERHRLRYPPAVHPCLIQGRRSLVVAAGLEREDPVGYQLVLAFAREQGLRVQPDRRRRARAVAEERRAEPWRYGSLAPRSRPEPGDGEEEV